MFEIRDPHGLLRKLEVHSKTWGLLIETPLGLYDSQYHVDLKKGGTQKNRLNKNGEPEKFNRQIAQLVGLTQTEFPSEVLNVGVELRPNQGMTHLVAKMLSVEVKDGIVDFEYPFTPNPLTFTDQFKSRLWIHHLKHLRQRDPFVFLQAAKRINTFCQKVRIYSSHKKGLRGTQEKQFTETLENNLLLLSPYWEWMGIDLGLHVTRFPDQPYANISITGHGRIDRGIELKYDSKGYTRSQYKSQPNGLEMLVLCFEHNDYKLLKGVDYLDVVDATELGRYMMGELSKIEVDQESN